MLSDIHCQDKNVNSGLHILLEKHSDEIAALETWDNGKPYEQASLVEVPMVVRVFRYYAGRC